MPKASRIRRLATRPTLPLQFPHRQYPASPEPGVGRPNCLPSKPGATYRAMAECWNRWWRNLTHTARGFGKPPPSSDGIVAAGGGGLPQLAPFHSEADLAIGRPQSPHGAPALGFAADLGRAGIQRAALELHYAVTPHLRLGLRYAAQRSNFGASASVAGLQFPGSSNSEQSVAVILSHHF